MAGDLSRSIGERLASVRASRGMTLRAAAGLWGVAHSRIAAIEKGDTTVDADHLEKAARAYMVPVVMLIPGAADLPDLGPALSPEEARVIEAVRSRNVKALFAACADLVDHWLRNRDVSPE